MRRSFKNDKYILLPKLLDINEAIMKLHNPIILNDYVGPKFIEKVREKLLISKKDRSVFASCECGYLEGNYYIGSVCPKCKTKVEKKDNVKNNIVIEIPFDISVLHPQVYLQIKRNNFLSKLTNIMFDVKKKIPKNLQTVITKQGFVYNEDEFISIVETAAKLFKKEATPYIRNFIKFIKLNRNLLFTNKLLLSSFHIMDSSRGNLIIIDKDIRYLLQSVYDILSLQIYSKSATSIHSVLFKAYESYINYLSDFFKNKSMGKKGIFRGSLFGTSLFFTMRAVANPITCPHQGDEIYIPWKAAIEVFKYQIINKLVHKFNFSIYESLQYINKHIIKYSVIIDGIFKELIAESPFKGIPAIVNRNPSIKMGSLVLVFITKVLPINKNTIKVSNLIITNMNLDFDGDHCSVWVFNEINSAKIFKYLHPMYQAIGYNNIKISTYTSKNLILNFNNWFHDQ